MSRAERGSFFPNDDLQPGPAVRLDRVAAGGFTQVVSADRWPDDWAAMVAGVDCSMCRALGHGENHFGLVVVEGRFAEVHLQRRTRIPGYCGRERSCSCERVAMGSGIHGAPLKRSRTARTVPRRAARAAPATARRTRLTQARPTPSRRRHNAVDQADSGRVATWVQIEQCGAGGAQRQPGGQALHGTSDEQPPNRMAPCGSSRCATTTSTTASRPCSTS
jgi:hypothetical protein